MSIEYKDPLCKMAFVDWFYENYGQSYGGQVQSVAKAAWEFAASIARAQPADEVQPVAWRDEQYMGGVRWDESRREGISDGTALYTRPPAADADRLDAKRWRAMRATTTALRNSDGERIECTPEELDAAADSLIAKLAAIDALAASKEKKE